MSITQRSLKPTWKVTPYDSMSLSLDQAQQFLEFYLEEDCRLEDATAKTMIQRLHNGVKKDLEQDWIAEQTPLPPRRLPKRKAAQVQESPRRKKKKQKKNRDIE